mgnify:CR=1 FL=1
MRKGFKPLKILLVAILILPALTLVCRAEEQITITTYYPAPNGIYKNLITENLTVNGTMTFSTINGANMNLSGNLTVAGSVGIGTTTLDTRLTIDKGNTVGAGIWISGTNDTRVMIGRGQSSVWSWANGWTTLGDFSLIEEGVSGSRIYVKPGGNVGLGTINPRSNLEVTGSSNTCVKKCYGSNSGTTSCPSSYYMTLPSANGVTPQLNPDITCNGVIVTGGWFMCCKTCTHPDHNNNGICDDTQL